jgi:hypothetical protein
MIYLHDVRKALRNNQTLHIARDSEGTWLTVFLSRRGFDFLDLRRPSQLAGKPRSKYRNRNYEIRCMRIRSYICRCWGREL